MKELRKSGLPSVTLASEARNYALRVGLVEAARTIGVSTTTLALIAARLPGHHSTHLLAAAALGVKEPKK